MMNDVITQITGMISRLKQHQAPGETDFQTFEKIIGHYEQAQTEPTQPIPQIEPPQPEPQPSPPESIPVATQAPEPAQPKYRFKPWIEIEKVLINTYGQRWKQYNMLLSLPLMAGKEPAEIESQNKMHVSYLTKSTDPKNSRLDTITYEGKIISFLGGMVEPVT